MTSQKTRVDDITSRLMRRYSTAAVLFHHAVAERLGLGPTDHKCLDLLRERGAMTGSELAAITGLTTGAITGVVSRLERSGYLRREPDPVDGRKQRLSPIGERMREIHAVMEPIRAELTDLLRAFDAGQLAAVAEFLDQAAVLTQRHAVQLRAEALSVPGVRAKPAARAR